MREDPNTELYKEGTRERWRTFGTVGTVVLLGLLGIGWVALRKLGLP